MQGSLKRKKTNRSEFQRVSIITQLLVQSVVMGEHWVGTTLPAVIFMNQLNLFVHRPSILTS